eukprot:281904-Rhodomonas_salina.1
MGTLVTVYGSGFSPNGLVCQFGSSISSGQKGTWHSDSKISCVAPMTTALGVVSVDVSNNDGVDFTSAGLRFQYEVGATVQSLYPPR